MSFPKTLLSVSQVYWCGKEIHLPNDNADHEVTIVTAFFDTGRGNWEKNIKSGHYRRTNDTYLQYFSNLAIIRNKIIILTDPEFASDVLQFRANANLAERTAVITIYRIFDSELINALHYGIKLRMNARLSQFVWSRDAPEYNEPKYVIVNALKSVFVCTAIELGFVNSEQVAWIDFGYCRDGDRFDPATPWRFNSEGKMNLFRVMNDDKRPIFQVVRSGAVFFHGSKIVGPKESWGAFSDEIRKSMTSLMECDLIDDDQTLLLMAWRRQPELYNVHNIQPGDFFVVFKNFDAGKPIKSVELPAPIQIDPKPAWIEELAIAIKRQRILVRRSWKRWLYNNFKIK